MVAILNAATARSVYFFRAVTCAQYFFRSYPATNKALVRLDPDTKAILERIDEFNPRFPVHSGTLATDPNDNLWIGGRGLGKYDGNNFTVFNRANSPLITPNGYDVGIRTIKPDAQGRIWLATNRSAIKPRKRAYGACRRISPAQPLDRMGKSLMEHSRCFIPRKKPYFV